MPFKKRDKVEKWQWWFYGWQTKTFIRIIHKRQQSDYMTNRHEDIFKQNLNITCAQCAASSVSECNTLFDCFCQYFRPSSVCRQCQITLKAIYTTNSPHVDSQHDSIH